MKLSIGMMVKNEAGNLARCLDALQPLRDAIQSELIIVDTGSEDDTVSIARRYTDRVYFHPWNNDFSAMRNITIGYATGEWFLVIDADEVLENAGVVADFLKSKASKKYNAALVFVNNYTHSQDLNKFSTLISTRLFRKNKKFCYAGAVHNQPVFDGPIADLKTTIHHYGYVADDKELMEKKFIRTSAILQSELAKDPDHIYYLYQMSVTYGMHNDFPEAIDYIERAYRVFEKLGRPKSTMFVLTHRAMMYQMVRRFKKVEEVCLDALQVNEGYIDIYYYLAEAQAVLGKVADAIGYYEKYLEMLAGYYDRTEMDPGVIDYTLGNAEVAYFNLSNLYKKQGDFAKALPYAEKITAKKSILENLATIMDLYLQLGQYSALKQYGDTFLEQDERHTFYQYIEKLSTKYDEQAGLAIAQVFCQTADSYGLLKTLLLEARTGVLSELTMEKVRNVDFSNLPLYCGGILYYLVKLQFPLSSLLVNFKETWLTPLFEYCAQYYPDLAECLWQYLCQLPAANSTSEMKLTKTLCRYILILDKLTEEDYLWVFIRYLETGVAYMRNIYAPCVLADEMVYEVKNDEEVFLVYMYSAQLYKAADTALYVRALRNALAVFPVMKRGIEILLCELQESRQDELSEFEQYKLHIKTTIRTLIANGKLSEAKTVLGEYKSIVPDDMESVLLESQILLH